jgi:hypothetical protein
MKSFISEHYRKLFKHDETRFIISVGLKVSLISMTVNLLVYYFLFQVMKLNLAFFKAHGFPEFYENTPFFDYVLQESLEQLPVFVAFHVFLFFIGVYVGWLILRPFRIIGEYCELVISNPNIVYKIDEFSTYRLLTRFSEFFFEYLRESRVKGELNSNSIPPQFSRIHQPVADKIFMLHFGILLVIIVISSCLFMTENAESVYRNMVDLATETLSDKKTVNKFFSNQMFILDEITRLVIVGTSIAYTMLGFHLYNKVAGSAFGIFSTMRSFMKGNHFSRVHLVGYSYIRDYTRKLNKYLDYMENNFSKSKSKD